MIQEPLNLPLKIEEIFDESLVFDSKGEIVNLNNHTEEIVKLLRRYKISMQLLNCVVFESAIPNEYDDDIKSFLQEVEESPI